MEREFSAGGVCVRRIRGRDWMAAVRVKNGKMLALPKGWIDPGEKAPETAVRVVSFFLLRYLSGNVKDHDHEVDSAEWVPLEDAPRLLEYKGERDMVAAALTALREER